MKKSEIKIFVFFLFVWLSCSYAQQSTHELGMKALTSKDTSLAQKLFEESVRENDDLESRYELAMIQLNHNTFYSRNRAFENLEYLSLSELKNLKYRYAFADLCKDFARLKAISEYKEIIGMDSTQVRAWFELAKQEAKEFDDYNHSVRVEDEFSISLQHFANEDFEDAKNYFNKAIKYDPLNRDVLFQFALLNEKAGNFSEAINLIKKLIANKIADKEIHLALGLLYYKTNKLKECYEEYKLALSMMSPEEKEDFTYNSVKLLLQPVFDDIFSTKNEIEIKEFIELYWKIFDPLYMTDYNERLLEHYSRVAYANLHFSVPKMGIAGWKTNRGETVIRFGEPFSKVRIRPTMENVGLMMKTEVWNYPDMVFGFTDMALNNNYIFAAPAGEKDKVRPQFAGDSNSLAQYLRKARYYTYDPKFEGPKFEVPFTFSQFKSYEKRNHTDLYINYGLYIPDSMASLKDSLKSFDIGFSMFDKNSYDQFFHNTKTLSRLSKNTFQNADTKNQYHTQVFQISMPSDSGIAAFEIMRKADKGVFANRGNLVVRKFSNYNLDISDLLFASNVEYTDYKAETIQRGDLNILPSAKNTFTEGEPLYLFYEVYNLKRGENMLTDFQQSIIIEPADEKSDLANAVSSVGKFLGLSGENKITLTSKYKTQESDPKIYLQLDLSKYDSGKYKITVEIKDNLTNKIVSTLNELVWEKK